MLLILTYISISQNCFGGEKAAVKGGWADTFFNALKKKCRPKPAALDNKEELQIYYHHYVRAYAYTGGFWVDEHVHDLKKNNCLYI